MIRSRVAALALLFILTACGGPGALDQLRTTRVSSEDAFSNALVTNYLAFAEEHAGGQVRTAQMTDYFASKGLAAARDGDVLPEDPEEWGLEGDALAPLAEARTKLLAVIPANRTTQPEMTASAIVAYDRWVEHAAQSRTASAEDPQATFTAILTKLSEAHTATTEDTPTTTTPEKSMSAVFYFPLDGDQLGDSAQAALFGLAREVQSKPKAALSVNGHADRTGSEEHNMDLSKRRAVTVVRALEKIGIAPRMISFFAFGETDPAVATEDGVEEPLNRRVEVFIE